MKSNVFLSFFFFLSIQVFSQKVVYNQAGYLPNKSKRVVIESNSDMSGTPWVIKEQLEQVKML